MCGICGIWQFKGEPVDPLVLSKMQGTLRHRGPDSEGTYLEGSVGLAHRRLSIIDLDTGHQPMSNEDGTVWITFNGEIYNFQELRRELEAQGHTFRSRSDTETIVHLYEEMGPRCVERLRGMFAFAIWDVNNRRLMLARDRIGIKPLYYKLDDSSLIFASELKALLETGKVDRNINMAALHSYLLRDYVPSPLTILEGVQKLPPAHTFVFENGRGRLEAYWSIDYASARHEYQTQSLEEYSEQLESLLQESVGLRMISDVPIGVFMSGGVDSSAIAAMMARISNHPIKTFSIGTNNRGFDELKYAKIVAQHLGTEHHEFIVEPDAVKILPELIASYDEPFADSSAVPTYYVSQMASQHVKVCLSGDGGDELFAGYSWYQMWNREKWILNAPWWLRQSLFGTLHKALPNGMRGKSHLHTLTRRNRSEHYASTKMSFPPWDLRNLLSSDLQAAFNSATYSDNMIVAGKDTDSLDYLSAMQHVDLKTYLPDDILVKVDRASMMHSLEVRVPFLDHKLVEFAAGIPSEYKVRDGEPKYILKKLLSKYVPSEAIYRPKMGFAIPLENWFRGGLGDYAKDILLDKKTQDRGFFNTKHVKRILDQQQTRNRFTKATSTQIWSLLVFELWCRQSSV